MVDTAVALFVFNRPETTRQVFERIRQARPRLLLLVADGPRAGHPDDARRCAEVQALLAGGVDWPCEVRRNISATNVGCGRRMLQGLDWVFSEVEEAIILEDDCLPDPTFFRYCAEQLARYRDDERIGAISGMNHQYRPFTCAYSYYFSAYAHSWGWASWRRAWRHNDITMHAWPAYRASGRLEAWLDHRPKAIRYWRGIFDGAARGEFNAWDYQWTFCCWNAGMLSILPGRSLVRNIGFGADATHTRDANALPEPTVGPMDFPLRHPVSVAADTVADAHTESVVFRPEKLRRRWARRLRATMRRLAGRA